MQSRLKGTLLVAFLAVAGCTSALEVGTAAPEPTPALRPLPTAAPTPAPLPEPTPTPLATPEPQEPPQASNDFVEKNTPVDVLKEGLARTGLMGSYHYLMRMTLTPRSSGLTLNVPLTVEGDFNRPGDFRSVIDLSLRGVDITSREVSADGQKYQTDPATGLWYRTTAAATPAGDAIDFLAVDPDDLTDVEVLGRGILDGVNVYRIRANAAPGLVGASPEPLELNYWLGIGDLIVRQMSVDGVISWPQADQLLDPGARGRSAVSMTMKLSGFGRPADIQAPDPSVLGLDLSALDVVTTPAAPISAARGGQVANLLQSGKVIVTGGDTLADSLTTTEIYDPGTDTWSLAADLAEARTFHTASLLPDGKVLVAAGSNGSVPLATAEIFDPSSGEWSAAGSISAARASHRATTLQDGRIVLTGGGDATEVFTTVDIYDPASGAWSAGADMLKARAVHSATLLADGRILVAGGLDKSSTTFSEAEIYDPGTDTWTAVSPKNSAVAFQSAVLLKDGRVLVAGGVGDNGIPVLTAEVYDPATDTWTVVSPANDDHIGADPILLPDGRVVLIAGGDLARTSSSIEIYDPAEDTWTLVGKLATPRGIHSSVLLDSGKILIIGGGDSSGPTGSVELFDPAS